ncbi:MAG: flagellar motor protein MotB [Oscillospiraceae bacterium]
MRRHADQEEEDKGYNWQDTYGDMVTLLLCFFVLLFSFSSINAEKWEQLVKAFTGSTGDTAVVALDETTIRDEPINDIDSMVDVDDRDDTTENVTEQNEINSNFDALYEKLTAYIKLNDLEGQLSISRTDDVIIIRFSEMAVFNSGEADILPGNEGTIQHVIEMISDNISAISMINIEGHTDNVPISSAEFADNWDLSTKRATNMLREVLKTGLIDVSKISAIGYGEYHPVAPNDTPEGRAQNRRVDFVLQKQKVSN